MELNYPLWKRIAKSLVTVPVVLGFVIMVFAAAYGNLALQIFLTYHDNGWSNVTHAMNQPGYDFGFITFLIPNAVPGIFFGIFVGLMWPLFELLARALSHWENYKRESKLEWSITVKTFAFYFLAVFGYVSPPCASALCILD